MFITETWMTDLARTLAIPNDVIRERNFYAEGGVTPFGQKICDSQVRAVPVT